MLGAEEFDASRQPAVLLNQHALLSIDAQCCGAASVSWHAERSEACRESPLLGLLGMLGMSCIMLPILGCWRPVPRHSRLLHTRAVACTDSITCCEALQLLLFVLFLKKRAHGVTVSAFSRKLVWYSTN